MGRARQNGQNTGASKERGKRGHLVTPPAPPTRLLLPCPLYKQTKGQRGAALVQGREGPVPPSDSHPLPLCPPTQPPLLHIFQLFNGNQGIST